MQEAMDRAARFFDADYAGYDDDLPALEAYVRRTGGPLLELGCGTGRLLVPLAMAGYKCTGVDLSPEMLAIARTKAAGEGCSERIDLIQADFAGVPLSGSYGLAFIVMNTFLHLPNRAAQLSALRRWREHLAPRGLLLIDVFHPDVGQLAAMDGRLEWDKTWTDPATGHTVMKFMTRTVDLAEQRIDVTLVYDEVDASGGVRRTLVPFAHRYLWRYEAEWLLETAGFRLEGIFGDWDMSPFAGDSPRMILVAARARR